MDCSSLRFPLLGLVAAISTVEIAASACCRGMHGVTDRSPYSLRLRPQRPASRATLPEFSATWKTLLLFWTFCGRHASATPDINQLVCNCCGVGISFDTAKLAKATEILQEALEAVPNEITIKFHHGVSPLPAEDRSRDGS